ncbi:MAG: zf-HC2 domain-containing protein [Terriglobales bacterium]
MTDVPKIVHERLRAAELEQRSAAGRAPDGIHPDANLLAAFAEQALSANERDRVLEHLALCSGCREVVVIGLPAESVGTVRVAAEVENDRAPVSVVSKPASRNVFAWPSLRWAALAAGVAVVGSVLLLRPGKLNQSSGDQKIASTAASRSADGRASIAAATSNALAAKDRQEVIRKADDAPSKANAPLPEGALSQKVKGQQTLRPHSTESPMLLARNKKSSGQADKLAEMPTSAALAFDNSASRQTTETTEVAAAAGEVSQASADMPSGHAALMARTDAPAIEKAKPALPAASQGAGLTVSDADQQQGAKTVGSPAGGSLSTPAHARSVAKLALSANPTTAAAAQLDSAQRTFAWTIIGGILRRSQDGGQTWQESLHADRSLLCYASYRDDIWAGGQGGSLYHSTDGGLTWSQIHPFAKNRVLTSDISQIDLQRHDVENPSQIVVSATNKEVWTSHDGGKTWETK